MARIKTVYSADMVAHLWANNHPHAIRTATGNLSAASGRIYSYGPHFVVAAFMGSPAKGGEKFVLYSSASYSNTTSKHQNLAWRALSGWQRADILSVPFQVSESDLRADDSGLAKVAGRLLESAADELEKAQKAVKHYAAHYGQAWRHIDDARRILAYLGDFKGIKALPVKNATLDIESRQSVKTESARIARYINGEKYLKQARDTLTRAQKSLDSADGYADVYRSDKREESERFVKANDVIRYYAESENIAGHAMRQYQQAGRKPSPVLARIVKACKAAREFFGPLAHTEDMKAARYEIERGINNARIHLAWASRYAGRDTFQLNSGRMAHATRDNLPRHIGDFMRRPFTESHFITAYESDKKRAAFMFAEFERLQKRYNRIRTGEALRDAIESGRDSIERYNREVADNARYLNLPTIDGIESAILNYLAQRDAARYDVQTGLTHVNRDALPRFYAEQCAAIAADINRIREEHAENARRVNAQRIEAWRAGENVSLPYDVPTMARIKGENVQTSKGASVPLSHAFRLVRMARIVAARGGQSWAPGEGPIVGHFRVTRIGGDMSAVIGCHNFDSGEALRAAEMIEQACAAMACDESTNG